MSDLAARAGWYPDPGGSNGQRYWDGAGWTMQSRPTPTKHDSPRWVWAAAAAVGLIALVIGVVVARVIASDDNQQRSLPTAPARVPAPPPVDTPHQAAPPAAVAPTPASTEACGPDEATALHTALSQLAPEPVTGRDWGSAPVEANYDPCADLSTILVVIRGGTGSSPVQALMFHRGSISEPPPRRPTASPGSTPAPRPTTPWCWRTAAGKAAPPATTARSPPCATAGTGHMCRCSTHRHLDASAA